VYRPVAAVPPPGRIKGKGSPHSTGRIFCMPRDFFDPEPENQIVILIDVTTLRKAEKLIAFCEQCDGESSVFPFDALLDKVTGADPSVTDYILESPAKCPTCRRDVFEKTLVAPSAL
jgi:hypothetical protein